MIQPEQQRRAYLEAMGIDVWVPRDQLDPEVEVIAASAESDSLDWSALRDTVSACTRCALHESRTQTVFGVGNPDADWMAFNSSLSGIFRCLIKKKHASRLKSNTRESQLHT